MSQESPTPDFIQQTAEAVARLIQWIATLIRRRNWFMLLVFSGVMLALLGNFFQEKINTLLAKNAQGPFWASFWTFTVLLFIGALAIAVVTMPRATMSVETEVDEGKAIKGLRPFERKDAAIFAKLQRKDSLRECCDAVTDSNYKFGILTGESGCGKTSFLQAGVWPRLTKPDSGYRAIYVRFSDQEPMATVRKALAEQLEMPMEWVKDSSLSMLLNQSIEAAGKPLVLLFDQFEQFFVHNPHKSDRAFFIKELNTWYRDSDLDIRVLVSIRADLLLSLKELQSALQYSLGPQDLINLEPFTPEEATEIFAVIAESEKIDFDRRFVTEMVAQELAHRESGKIFPVDLQVLAWMIVRQKGDEKRAFNRAAFQRIGGVEGLLTRFLEYTLEPRILTNQRQATIKTLQALTDLDRQVRAGLLTLTDIQTKLKGTAQPDEIAEAVTWLSRSDVRLITPQKDDRDGILRYELAHERLIPALMRLAGRELTAANQANQLLERRVNEWLGNQQKSRFLLGWRELWLIRQQRPYLVWGTKQSQKEKLISLSQRRAYRILGLSGVVAIMLGTFCGWLNFTTLGQMQNIRWELSRRIESASDNSTAHVARALIRDNQHDRGMELIQNHIENPQTKAATLLTVADIAIRFQNLDLLSRVSEAVRKIDDPYSKSSALSVIAMVYGHLDKLEEAQALLEEARVSADLIVDPPHLKSWALSSIAGEYVRLNKSEQAQALLEKALASINVINPLEFKAGALIAIAGVYGQLDESEKALAFLEEALDTAGLINQPDLKSGVLQSIALAAKQLKESAQARVILEKVLVSATGLDDLNLKAQTLGVIIGAAGQLEEPEHVRAFLDKALAIASVINQPDLKSQMLINIARTFGQLEKTEQSESAIEKVEKVLDDATFINQPYYKSWTLSLIAEVYGQLSKPEKAQAALEKAIANADVIDQPYYKSLAFTSIAQVHGQLGKSKQAQAFIEKALANINAVDESFKFEALKSMAEAATGLNDIDIARALLIQFRQMAEKEGASGVLTHIAYNQAWYSNDWSAALRTLRTCLEEDRVNALAAILTLHAESSTPSLIDGPAVLAVEVDPKGSEAYEVSVSIQSPDIDCDRHTDWWEVLSEEGILLGRKIIDAPQDIEHPFTTQETINISDPNQVVIVRAHFSDDVDEDSSFGVAKYPTQAMKGKFSEPDSFKSIRLPANFAAQVEKQGIQPKECKNK
jgi:tetratricopeptide (TPR) repeat protein